MEKIPEVFDWVTARGECSVGRMFVLLMERVESDVAQMQALLDTKRRRLTFNKVADDKVIVANEQVGVGHVFGGTGVMFKRTPSGVVVDIKTRNGPERILFEARLSLGLEGRCRYEIDGHAVELWQVSRKAMEDLFFS